MDARKAAKRYGQPVHQRRACVAEDEFGAKRGLGSQDVFLTLPATKAVPVALSRIEVAARAHELVGRSAVECGLELAIMRREASTCPLGLVTSRFVPMSPPFVSCRVTGATSRKPDGNLTET